MRIILAWYFFNFYFPPDINECQEGTFDCREGTRCENNVGSYTCISICMPGFEYNRILRACMGELFVIIWKYRVIYFPYLQKILDRIQHNISCVTTDHVLIFIIWNPYCYSSNNRYQPILFVILYPFKRLVNPSCFLSF